MGLVRVCEARVVVDSSFPLQSIEEVATLNVANGECDFFNQQIGLTINKLRKTRSLTLIALGVAVGVTYQQVQKYERGTNRISASMLMKFAAALDVEPSQLLPGASSIPQAYVRSLSSSRDTDELVRRFVVLKPQQKRAVLHLLKTMSPDSAAAEPQVGDSA